MRLQVELLHTSRRAPAAALTITAPVGILVALALQSAVIVRPTNRARNRSELKGFYELSGDRADILNP